MANWITILDEDKARREAFISCVEPLLPPIDELLMQACHGEGWSVLWASAKSAPVNWACDEDAITVLWGEARESSGQLQTSAQVREGWQSEDSVQWDGYYCAIDIDANNGALLVGTDVLGLYPVYYWSNQKDVCLVASSPELFRHHPAFESKIDLKGLVGILLTNGLVGGKTIWQNVYRLAPGKRLKVADFVTCEISGFDIPNDGAIQDVPFRGHLRTLDKAMRSAVTRHTGGQKKLGFMLSGGLDSRILAGYLAELPLSLSGITFGDNADNEMICARKVADEIGATHVAAPPGEKASDSEQLARWEHLAAGFCGLYEWGYQKELSKTADRVMVGHLLDRVLGGIQVGAAYDAKSRSMGVDHVMAYATSWGMEPDQLKALLPDGKAHLVDEVLAELNDYYVSLSDAEHVRAWIFDLHHRQRFHVGGVLWPTTFGAWPVVPVLDRELISCCVSMPASTIADRRAQLSLMTTFFPRLAALPLDRNSADTLPETPSFSDYLRRSIDYRLDRAKKIMARVTGSVPANPIFYRRIYDFESPRWLKIREVTESNRSLLYAHLNGSQVDAIWPSNGEKTAFANPVKDPNPARLLVGFSMILRNVEPE